MGTSIKSNNGGDKMKEEKKVILKGVPASLENLKVRKF